jgi:hypothetical protein
MIQVAHFVHHGAALKNGQRERTGKQKATLKLNLGPPSF